MEKNIQHCPSSIFFLKSEMFANTFNIFKTWGKIGVKNIYCLEDIETRKCTRAVTVTNQLQLHT